MKRCRPESRVSLDSSLHLFESYVSKVKLATIVEGDPKATFSIAYYTKV